MAMIGKYNLTRDEPESVTSTVNEIKIHDDWKPFHQKWDADIAILVLNQTVKYSSRILPICLPSDGTVENVYDGYVVSSMRTSIDSVD